MISEGLVNCNWAYGETRALYLNIVEMAAIEGHCISAALEQRNFHLRDSNENVGLVRRTWGGMEYLGVGMA